MQKHAFHSSSRWLQRPDLPLYQEIDWSRVDAGHYAVVDPLDNHAILYLSEKAYQVQVRVSLSNDTPLIKLAGPGDKPVTSSDSQATQQDSSQKSPIHISKSNTKLWKKFLSWHLSALGRLGQKANAKSSPGSRDSSKASIDLSAAVLRTLIPYFGLDVHFRLGGDLEPPQGLVKALREFADRMVAILEGSGPQYLILYLKNTLFYLNKYAAGNPAQARLLEPPVSLARSGIPRIIPLLFRRRLTSREDLFCYRLINTILNGFRAMNGTHEPQDFSSIRGAHPELNESSLKEFQIFCKEVFWPRVVKGYMPAGKRDLLTSAEKHIRINSDDGVYIPSKAGPNATPGLLGAQYDAWMWHERECKGLRNYILEWCRHVGDTRTPEVFTASIGPNGSLVDGEYYSSWTHAPTLSKICCLPEPAGKVRTIAIVDYWTQRLMSPVHDWMMTILRHLPTDGTFNQEGATARIARQHKITQKTAYSIDLKSATDLIPIELYRAVFNGIWRPETVDLWIDLLTDRWFLVPPKEKLAASHLRGCSIRYGRGQPMGTLSSWPSMALVHHALELFSAQRAGYDPVFFVDYAVLGDDNVTLGTDVANAYVAVAEELCVPTSPAKTLSGDLFIFAQQIFLKGENISPLSLKEELGIRNFGERLELALRAIKRGWLDSGLTIPRFLRLLLSRLAYRKAHREWSAGRLGNIAKSALFSAFGIASGALKELLGFQGSGFKTLLSSLQGKVSALAGEQSVPAVGRRSNHSRTIEQEFERLLCIVLAKELQKRLHLQVARLEMSAIRFRMFGESIRDVGVMPYFTVIPSRGPGNKAPELPGISYPDRAPSSLIPKDWENLDFLSKMSPGKTPGTYVWKQTRVYLKPYSKVVKSTQVMEYPFNRRKFFHSKDELVPPQVFECSTQKAHVGLWSVIYDSYKELFGTIRVEERTPREGLLQELTSEGVVRPMVAHSGEIDESYQDFEAEEDAYGGMGMTSGSNNTVESPTGRSTPKPRIVSEVRKAKLTVEGILGRLRSPDSLPAPWLDLYEIAETLSKVSRCPDFVRWDDLLMEKETSNDDLRKVARLGKILGPVIAHLPLELDNFELSEADLPDPSPLVETDGVTIPRSVDLVQAKTNQGLLTGYNNSIVR